MRPHVFLDMDGVLADFDGRFTKMTGRSPREFEDETSAQAFWKVVNSDPRYFASLELMEDADELVNGVAHLNPTILTGLPHHDPYDAAGQKQDWLDHYFPGVPVVMCPSVDKCKHMKAPGDVLIDDWHRYVPEWRLAGGVYILHNNARSSLAALFAHYPELAA